MIQQLLENPYFNLIDKLDWYFLPVLNPDGYVQSNEDRCWRKSKSCFNDCPTGIKCTGVDLNRNWGHMWNQGDKGDHCNNGHGNYSGPEPFSEIETQNVRDFILAHNDKIKFFNTLHSYGQFIILPWSYTNAVKPPSYKRIEKLAKKGNAALRKVHDTVYEIGTAEETIGYTASGVSTDWALDEAKIPYVMCMELPPRCEWNDIFCKYLGGGFLLPWERIEPTAEEVWAFHEEVAKELIAEFVP